MACFHFLGKYRSLRRLSKTLVSSCIAVACILVLSDFRALLVSSLVMVLEFPFLGEVS